MSPFMRKRQSTRPADDARGLRAAIVASDYHGEIHEALLAGARSAFTRAGGREADLEITVVDGVYDLPPVVAAAFDAGVDLVVALGCVVRGETSHDRHISDAVFAQLCGLAVSVRRPIGLGVLTVESLKQARERAGGKKGDAGAFAMNAALRAHTAIATLGKGRRA